MVRVKTTTRGDTEFMSPFIYTKPQGEALVKKLKRWHVWNDRPILEMVDVPFDKKQEDCFFDQEFTELNFMDSLARAERYWQRH